MQIDNMLLDQITQNILGAFNKVGATREELTRKVNDIVRDAVERFDLVMRDEFETAMELLSNTRIKLEQMEKRIAELEAQTASGKNDSGE
ncbi:MAG: accessory factor UbiK family protein [Magnetococcales bacterium]|nr:accessory factor UbiK family protein [Magnetococcales bacterium]